ncbi:ribonuclease D [Micavibrio aeruginosavorus]|uniref:Ribonuclease D n=1 Tax=Micavibrio aeruginosavorus (strain ARL-13) TaxID=856793 RepID=G2KNM7_MICAA|nr:ribonuclease D [Micavibrio aeruginosavorus]AEP10272.1 ribonuclease D [Micavibrio aeruginosavorus ARL-13]
MTIISATDELKTLCHDLAQHPFITVDTEFLRDKTYFPVLCLIQVASPDGQPYAVDPLAEGIDLTPLYELMMNRAVLKVFHAARQDLEIFFNMMGSIPTPVFDTQVAAMVCGFGDQIGYLNLVQEICHQKLDKGAQFTDWSRRPLSDKQVKYALDDVTWLRDVYRKLDHDLKKRDRTSWVNEEMNILTDPATYTNPPDTAWKRIKLRTEKPKALAVLKEVAAWREREAQRRNVPRGRILRDETLADLAVHGPRTPDELKHIRNIGEDVARGKLGKAILEAVEAGLALPKELVPVIEKKKPLPMSMVPVVEMMKLLLRIVAAENEVAARLIADPDELEAIARDDDADVAPMKGWRFEVFGREALALKHGKIALGVDGRQGIRRIPVQ